MQLLPRVLVSFLSCTAVLVTTLTAEAQNQPWIRQLGSIGEDEAYAAAPDGSGGVYIGGQTSGSLGGPNAGGYDAWVAFYDGTGSQRWIRQIGTSVNEVAAAAAPDGSGGVYVSGWTAGNLGGQNASLEPDAWLARYDSAGNQRWIRQLGSIAEDEAYAAASDGSGGVYISGQTSGSLGGPNAGGYDAWVARYDGAGNQLWIRQLGTGASDGVVASAPDGSGGVYISGWTYGDLGGPISGYYDAWIARYDGSGNQLWIRQLGTSVADSATAAAPDDSGGVYITGWTLGSLGGPSAGYYDAWLARYDSAGNQQWIRQLGTNEWDEAHDAAPDGSGGVYIGGRTYGSLGGPNAGDYDVWLARYDGAGTQVWIHQFGTSSEDSSYAAAPDGSGGVYISGYTDGSLGGQNTGGEDAWLARFAPAPVLLCEPGVDGAINCPCSNPPASPGLGCDNSSATGGATIRGSGVASLGADTFAFTASGEKPVALSLLLQGTAGLPAGVVYGQGVRCAGGTLKRLFNRAASAGSVTLPNFSSGDTTVSARSAALGSPILAGQSRWYLIYYRDPTVLGGCPSSGTFNSGATMRVDWVP